jgi:hypothetical protein
MNFIGKECLHDCEADLSAAFAQVVAAIVDEAISEVMWVHQRVLRTSDHVT